MHQKLHFNSQVVDNRPEAIVQRRLQALANSNAQRATSPVSEAVVQGYFVIGRNKAGVRHVNPVMRYIKSKQRDKLEDFQRVLDDLKTPTDLEKWCSEHLPVTLKQINKIDSREDTDRLIGAFHDEFGEVDSDDEPEEKQPYNTSTEKFVKSKRFSSKDFFSEVGKVVSGKKSYKVDLSENGKKLLKTPFDEVEKKGRTSLTSDDYLDGYRSDDGYDITETLRKSKPTTEISEILKSRDIETHSNLKVKAKSKLESENSLFYENTPKEYRYKKVPVSIRTDFTEDERGHPRIIVAESNMTTDKIAEKISMVVTMDNMTPRAEDKPGSSFLAGLKGDTSVYDDLLRTREHTESVEQKLKAYKAGVEIRSVAMFSDAMDPTGSGLTAGFLLNKVSTLQEAINLFKDKEFTTEPGGLPSQNTGASGTSMFNFVQDLAKEGTTSFGKNSGTVREPRVDKLRAINKSAKEELIKLHEGET